MVTDSRFVFWYNELIGLRWSEGVHGITDDETVLARVEQCFPLTREAATREFQFYTEDFAQRFELCTGDALIALQQLSRRHLVRQIPMPYRSDLWCGTQTAVIRSARYFQFGLLLRNRVQRFVQDETTRALLQDFRRQPNVLRIVTGGNWLQDIPVSHLGLAVVVKPGCDRSALQPIMDALEEQMNQLLGVRHVLPPFLSDATQPLPTLFKRAVTLAPIPNWRVHEEYVSRMADQGLATQLYLRWQSLEPGVRLEKPENCRLMVHALALRHFNSQGEEFVNEGQLQRFNGARERRGVNEFQPRG